MIVGCIYRHPRRAKMSTTEFIDKLSKQLEMHSNSKTPLLLLGDVNINVNMTNDNTVQQYTNMLMSVGCENKIDIPTHFWENGRSTLDHIITNLDNEAIETGVLNNGKKGHLPIFAVVKDQLTNPVPSGCEDDNWRFIDERKKDQFISILAKNLTSIDLSEHPENILKALTTATQSAIEICFPLKSKSKNAIKRSLTPWYDSEIYKDEKTQSRLFRRFIKTKKPDDHKTYNTFRKKLSKKKYRAKKDYFHDLLDKAKNSDDKRGIWKIINKAFGKEKKKRILPRKLPIGEGSNSTTTECPKEIANILNNHFSNIAKSLAEKLEKKNRF